MKQLFIFIFLFCSTFGLWAQNADDILGNWLNKKQNRMITIYKKNDLYYGKIHWVADSEKGKGAERLDIKNPNENLKNRKIIGIDFLLSFSFFTDRKAWKGGRIYNYETGNTYTGKIHLTEEDDLELTGYYGILWFLGRTQTWTRAKEIPINQ